MKKLPTFHFNNLAIATRHHIAKRLAKLDWPVVRSDRNVSFSDKNLTLNEKVLENLEYKDKLANLLKSISPSIHPLTYCIDEENRDEILAKIFLNHYLVKSQYQSKRLHVNWIVKPALINNGNAIFVFTDFERLRAFFLSSERLGGPYVIQKYIDEPDLIDNYKYTYRMTVIVSNFKGIYLYNHGYINKSGYQYDVESPNIEVHLTNYFLQGKIPKVTQTFTGDLVEFPDIFMQMKNIVAQVFKVLLKKHRFFLWPRTVKAFELLGFDFILDNNKKLWLLEINQGPDFPVEEDHPMNAKLWDPFWQTILNGFVRPIGEHYKIDVMGATKIL